jgi:predicted O-methyltransferase YrrM
MVVICCCLKGSPAILCCSENHHGLCDCRHTSTPAEVLFLYQEQQQYLQHGVKLQQNGTVIDIGANIGLFSMLAAEVLTAPW